jgi:hypothetical protein
MSDNKKEEKVIDTKIDMSIDGLGDQIRSLEKEVQEGSRPRRAVGSYAPLKAAQRPGYVRRWVNDEPGRVKMFLEAGYSFVKDQNADLRSNNLNLNDRSGVVTAIINRKITDASTHKAYLMEIKQEWYEEDQKKKHATQIKRKMSYDPAFAHKKGVVPEATEFDTYNYQNSPIKK